MSTRAMGVRALTARAESAPARRARSLTRAEDLVEAGLATPERLVEMAAVAARYAVAITPDVADLIDPADPADPIGRQFLPDAAELDLRPEERADPIGDEPFSPLPGLVHRYPDRVLLKLVSVCPVYCRFCFRREMVGPGHTAVLPDEALADALAYVASNKDIWEVVVTGGDPLIASPRRLADLGDRLRAIDHVKVLRFHSRVPVVAPDRIDGDLIAALKSGGKATYVVVHANHPRELSDKARAALARLADAGIPLLSQSVLLRGVNDDPDVLGTLLRAFVENRVKPYYLHQGDLAPGTSHLRTSLEEGRELMRKLRGRLSGLCQPTYVLDIPGGYGKVPVGPDHVAMSEDGCHVEDINGRRHRYPPRPDDES